MKMMLDAFKPKSAKIISNIALFDISEMIYF